MNMYGYIVVSPDDEVRVVNTSSGKLNNSQLWNDIGGYYEVVAPRLLYGTRWSKIRILCDEEGLFKENPKVNKLASGLYAAPSAIVGNVVICKFDISPNQEPDILAFESPELEEAEKFIRALIEQLKNIKV